MGPGPDRTWAALGRRAGRRVVVGVTTGALLVGTAWAGAGLAPGGGLGDLVRGTLGGAPDPLDPTPSDVDATGDRPVDTAGPVGRIGPPASPPGRPGGRPTRPLPGPPWDRPGPGTTPGTAVPDDVERVRVGTGWASLDPVPPEGQSWRTDAAACSLTDPSVVGRLPGTLESLLSRDGHAVAGR